MTVSKARLIVLEGADSSGKTSLAKAIGGVYLHATPFVDWVEEAHLAMIATARKRIVEGQLVVFDRHWVSELIYGPIFRKRVAYEDEVAEAYDLAVRELGCYVLCVPSDAAAHEARFQRERPEKKDLFDTMSEVAEVYRRLAHGYMHEERDDLIGRYVRHGDFTLKRCLVYDLNRDGKRMDDIANKLKEGTIP